jgi:catechol 2,3-dioxygenase
MISGGNATVYVSNLDAAIQFYAERLGLKLTNRIGQQWATVQTGPSYWGSDEGGAGLTIGLHPHSATYPAPGTPGGIGLGLETYEPIEDVSSRLTGRGVHLAAEIVTFEAGKVVNLNDQDGLSTYLWEITPEMMEGVAPGDNDRSGDATIANEITGGHAIVYVRDVDSAVRFYTGTLGLSLTYRFGDHIAFVEAGRLVIAIHPKTPRTPDPGAKGSVALGLTIDEPIERVVARMTTKGVRFTGPIVREATDAFIELEDPDGNTLYFWEDTKQEIARAFDDQAVESAS